MIDGINSGIILPPQPTTVVVQLEPALNVLNTIGVLKGHDSPPGMSNWADEVYKQLPEERRWQSMLLLWGIGVEAVGNMAHDISSGGFPALLSLLASIDPIFLRDTIMWAHLHSAHRRVILDLPPIKSANPDTLLANREMLKAYLEEQYGKELKDLEFFYAFHTLLNDPPALKNVLLDYLTYMWETFVADEWMRVRPKLEAYVAAYTNINLSNLSLIEAMRVITGRDLSTVFDLDAINQFEMVRFIPSLHNGPYVTPFGDRKVLNILYGARMPSGLYTAYQASDRVELLHRLKSLADEMRLNILYLLAEQGELGTSEIMDAFDLNKSAASRHLRSLNANGLIIERRNTDNKSKFYSVNPQIIRAVNTALASLILD